MLQSSTLSSEDRMGAINEAPDTTRDLPSGQSMVNGNTTQFNVDEEDFTAKEAAERLGISVQTFNSRVRDLGIVAVGRITGAYGSRTPLYSAEQLQLIAETPITEVKRQRQARKEARELAEAMAKRESFARAEESFRDLDEQYPEWQSAIGKGCHYMENLNRYAKNPQGGYAAEYQVYELKASFLLMLRALGFVTNLGRLGFNEFGQLTNEDGAHLEFIEYEVQAGNATYTWHQPVIADFVLFRQCKPVESNWRPRSGPRNLEIELEQIPEAMRLIQFLIHKWQFSKWQIEETARPVVSRANSAN